MQQLRKDLENRQKKGGQKAKEKEISESLMAEPPDKGGGSGTDLVDPACGFVVGNHCLKGIVAESPIPREIRRSIKDQDKVCVDSLMVS